MKTLQNEKLTIQVSSHGAELCSLMAHGKEYLWQADPAFWKRHSPVLFPIVGGVWENEYRVDGTTYPLSQHGFARDMDFTLVKEEADEVQYELQSSDETLKKYPFQFKLQIGYKLIDDKVRVMWQVTNADDKDIWFQIGAHPAFYFPYYGTETDDRGFFGFDKQDINYIRLSEKGCADPTVHYQVPLEDGFLPLNTHTFDIDTFIIEDSQLKEVTLYDLQKQPVLGVQFDAPLVGLWSPPTKNAPFVCIEPWYGRCDRAHFTGDYKEKDWIQHLPVGGVFQASYDIKIY
ncbi:MAG: aldose 1-epimerase family protein [Bacteroidales bacterium]|nr:aldose 1-epimerase family protein [Bacteroidales bacterium]